VAKKPLIQVTESVRRRLEELAADPGLSLSSAKRVRILLLAQEAEPASDIARKVGVSATTVRRLCKTFRDRGPTAVVPELASVPTSNLIGDERQGSEELTVGPAGTTCVTGQAPPHGEQRLRSAEWPAGSQVLWTVVPTGGPGGAPALTWQVSVATSRPGYVTYWLTVKNLTPAAVPFECRSLAVEDGLLSDTGQATP
jgi:hypothetical protein